MKRITLWAILFGVLLPYHVHAETAFVSAGEIQLPIGTKVWTFVKSEKCFTDELMPKPKGTAQCLGALRKGIVARATRGTDELDLPQWRYELILAPQSSRRVAALEPSSSMETWMSDENCEVFRIRGAPEFIGEYATFAVCVLPK